MHDHDAFLKTAFSHPRIVELLIRGVLPARAADLDFATLRKEPTEQIGERTVAHAGRDPGGKVGDKRGGKPDARSSEKTGEKPGGKPSLPAGEDTPEPGGAIGEDSRGKPRRAFRRRYPDLIWRASYRSSRRDLVVLMEFQNRPERLMALRTMDYAGSAVHELINLDRARGRAPREFVVESLVLHHGTGRWTAPKTTAELLHGSDLGRYRLVEAWIGGTGHEAKPQALDLPRILLGLARR